MADVAQLKTCLENFQKKCIDLATFKNPEKAYEAYEQAREELLSQPELLPQLPSWVASRRYGSQFWSFMKSTSSSYQGRREFIWESLAPVFDYIEQGATEPTAISLESLLTVCNAPTVTETWKKIQSRRTHDPEGAITAARSLVEATCKYILDELGVAYTDQDDLRDLYKKTATAMNLSPGQHNEQIFKQILSGCSSAIDGFAALRNSLGDADSKGKKNVTPSPRHADLAVNLAGTIATFLIATYEDRHKSP